jgi:hypothetical protein
MTVANAANSQQACCPANQEVTIIPAFRGKVRRLRIQLWADGLQIIGYCDGNNAPKQVTITNKFIASMYSIGCQVI